MLIRIPNVLTAEQVAEFREALEQASWADGRLSAGYLSQTVKRNAQLADTDPTARALFTSAALPRKVLPPLFNRYGESQTYGPHIDGAIRPFGDGAHRVRTDLSATLFLSPPESYDGGELVVQDTLGERSVKLSAGDLVLYPGTSIHLIAPVTRGVRLAAFFWIESMVRGNTERDVLFQLDNAIQRLASDVPEHTALVELAGVYHNLLRCWAET
jgi:PKHD-type hydroxylase